MTTPQSTSNRQVEKILSELVVKCSPDIDDIDLKYPKDWNGSEVRVKWIAEATTQLTTLIAKVEQEARIDELTTLKKHSVNFYQMAEIDDRLNRLETGNE